MSTVKLSVDEWKTIRTMLQEEHPRTVFMLRNKMKQVLGFTVREHKAWIDSPTTIGDDLNYGYSELQIHLDFYNERKYTMFLLKFSEHIKEKK